MEFKGLEKRTDVTALVDFLLYGMEYLTPPPNESYDQRLTAAQEKIDAFLSDRFPDRRECDKISTDLWDQIGTFSDVYFEVGLLTGARLAMQFTDRLKALK